MPRPRSLTETDLAQAALSVIDRDGLAALSMRAVAGELGMSTMGLYRYVTDRDQLEGLVVNLLLGAVDLTLPARASWQRQLRTLMAGVWSEVGAHPQVVPLLLTNRHSSAASTAWGETVLEVLTRAGFGGKDRVIAFRALVSYLIGALQLEHLGPLAGSGTEALAGLPAEKYPRITENARTAMRIPADEEFLGGLQIVLRGLSP